MAAPTILSGILTGGSNSHETTSEEANAVATDFVSEGIVGTYTNTSGVAPSTGAFAVNATGTPDTNINISTGVAYVAATPTSQNSQTLRVKCTVAGTLAISSNSSGSTKYDWIYISVSATNAANPAVGADNVATVVASRSTSASTDDGTPPTYGYPIAVVTVSNGFSTITNGNIRDVRTNSIVNLGSSSVSSGWVDLGFNPNTVTANGNRSYSLVFNSTDLTGTLSPGMRLKTTRLVAAPTQCTDLEASSSQYYNKTSPAGMTFTDDFVVSAWVKLESYTAQGIIASRYNGTSGWQFGVNTSGQVLLYGYNAGAGNTQSITSYQSVPLNKWTHVTAQLDMSTAGSSVTTSYVMMDGVDVPALKAATGSGPTALIQAGNLEIGASNGGLTPWDGKLAQVAIYSAKVTQANILATISQTLTGSETSLISAYTFSNTINDLSANANNLTAQGSAVATNSDSPFGTQASGSISSNLDYGIITSATFSTNTTLVVQVPEGCTVPTSGGVSAVSYSTNKTPYNLPSDWSKYRVSSLLRTAFATTSNATFGAFILGGYALVAPIGRWVIGHRGNYYNATTTTVAFNLSPSSLAGLTVTTGFDVSPLQIQTKASAAATYYNTATVQQPVSLAAPATYVMQTVGATTGAGIEASTGLSELFAECAYI